MADTSQGGDPGNGMSRFTPELMYAAASMYYLHDATQAEVAAKLGTSRPTVSRLLSEARRRGIVRIEVTSPTEQDEGQLALRTAECLGLDRVFLSASARSAPTGAALAPALSTALQAAGLTAGDVLLVSSGRTIYEMAQAQMPSLPGVLVVPTVGGQEEPEPWYQTNEITRLVAAAVHGHPAFLYAPALPGPGLHDVLLHEPMIRRVIDLWSGARCAIVGVGAPPLLRESIPSFVPTDAVSLRAATGDVCSRFYDRVGEPVTFPGSERLVATPLDVLRSVPTNIALAAGAPKVTAIVAGARGGWFNQLVTDAPTAAAILASADAPTVDGLAG